jgi:hypothetical protein
VTVIALLLLAVAAPGGPADAKGKGKGKDRKVQAVKKSLRAWELALDHAPASATALIAIDVAKLRGTALYQQGEKALVRSDRETAGALREACKLEGLEAIDSVALVVDGAGEAGFYVSWKTMDEGAMRDCAAAVSARFWPDAKFEAEKTGSIVSYRFGPGGEVMHLAWVGTHAMVIATRPGDRALLEQLTGGAGGFRKHERLKPALAATRTSSAMWGVYLTEEDLSAGRTARWAAGRLDVTGGNIVFELSADLGDAGSATAAADELRAFRDQLAGQAPPGFDVLVRALQVATRDAILVMSLDVSEADLLAALGLVLGTL